MKRRWKALLLAAALTPAFAAAASTGTTPAVAAAAKTAPVAAKRPNVVVFLVDDMGFSDIGSYGSEIPTPNIDALAADGLRFTQFYNTARCSTSRASLLTGLYPHQAGMGFLEPRAPKGARGTTGKLLDRSVTIAEVLRDAGYKTGMAGKWHLGISHGVGPWQRGFDRSLASPFGEIYFPGQKPERQHTLYIDGRKVDSSSPEVGTGDWYSPDLFVDWSTEFFHEAEQEGKPFFLYIPFVGVHFPVKAPAEDIARFKGKYLQGWDKLRQARYARQQAMGLVPNTKLTDPLPVSYDWEKLSDTDRERFDSIMAVYAAAINRMDKAVGDLVARLKESGEYDNTLILFMSDNGGNAESGPDGRAEGGVPGSRDSTVFVGLNWATLQNTPFSYFKHFTEEGGISTPLIAHWPNGIDKRLNGSFVRAPGHLVDVMPTVLDITGAKYPAVYHGNEIVPESGRSFAPSFQGKALNRKVPIFWEHEGNRAVRAGKWKIVARFLEPWELYDIDADRGETRDLAAAHPDIVRKLANAYDVWAERSYVDPWDKKNWGGAVQGRLDATAARQPGVGPK